MGPLAAVLAVGLFAGLFTVQLIVLVQLGDLRHTAHAMYDLLAQVLGQLEHPGSTDAAAVRITADEPKPL